MTTPTGIYEFPLKAADYYHINSGGLQFEAADVRKCIQEGNVKFDKFLALLSPQRTYCSFYILYTIPVIHADMGMTEGSLTCISNSHYP